MVKKPANDWRVLKQQPLHTYSQTRRYFDSCTEWLTSLDEHAEEDKKTIATKFTNIPFPNMNTHVDTATAYTLLEIKTINTFRCLLCDAVSSTPCVQIGNPFTRCHLIVLCSACSSDNVSSSLS